MAEEEDNPGVGKPTIPSVPQPSRPRFLSPKMPRLKGFKGAKKSANEKAAPMDIPEPRRGRCAGNPPAARKPRSWVWDHFELIRNPRSGRCNTCKLVVSADSVKVGTASLHSHYKSCSKRHRAGSTSQVGDKTQETAPPGFKLKSEENYGGGGGGGGDLVEFRGLARLPRHHATLLEEECLDNPGLAECPGRSARWMQFAYETIGELLFFLRTTRHGEMDGGKLARLRQLWEEAPGPDGVPDLLWVGALVSSALDSGTYLERQREAVAALEGEMQRLDGERDMLRCQLATLTMLMGGNEQARAALGVQLQGVKDRVKATEEAFLY